MYVSVTLNNVNLCSCSETQVSLICALHEDVDGGRSLLGGGRGRRLLAMEDGEDSAAGPLQRTYLAESSAETSTERSQRLATLR